MTKKEIAKRKRIILIILGIILFMGAYISFGFFQHRLNPGISGPSLAALLFIGLTLIYKGVYFKNE